MSGNVDTTSPIRPRLEPIARWVTPIAMGVASWVILLLIGAVVVSIDSLSILSILLVVVVGVLALPVYQFRPWEAGLTDRVFRFGRTHRRQLIAAAAMFVFVRLPLVPDLFGPIVGLLLFPLRGIPQVLFDVRVFYGSRIGSWAGQLVFDAGRFYIEFLWLYLIGTGFTALIPGGGE